MKDFLNEFLASKGLKDQFWRQDFVILDVKPPVPKTLTIKKQGDIIIITEAHSSGWLSQVFHDDLEMQFRVNGEEWTPLYLKEGSNRPRFTYKNEAGAITSKPIVIKRQRAFAERWAMELTVKGFVRGMVERILPIP